MVSLQKLLLNNSHIVFINCIRKTLILTLRTHSFDTGCKAPNRRGHDPDPKLIHGLKYNNI